MVVFDKVLCPLKLCQSLKIFYKSSPQVVELSLFPLQICFCSATGASFCYLLSYLVGRRLVRRYLPERSAQWAEKVEQHRDNMLAYIIFLR